MANIQVKLRRGTEAEHDTTNGGFTGAEGEVTVDTTNDTLRVHDGTTAGGHELRRKDDTIAGSEIDAGAVTSDKISTTDIKSSISICYLIRSNSFCVYLTTSNRIIFPT